MPCAHVRTTAYPSETPPEASLSSRAALRNVLAAGFLALLFLPLAAGAAEDSLRVGFGETDITPTVEGRTVYLAGFGHNRKAVGVLDPLKARAVVLQQGKVKLALVSVDLVGFFYPQVEKVRQQLPGFTYVLVSSTHNHEGPDTLGLWGPSAFQSGLDPDYMDHVRKQIVAAVTQAEAAVQPANLRLGSVQAPELLRDSREPYVKHDDLVVLDFRTPGKEDRPAGLVVQWNCHPETLESKNTRVSADFVGFTVRQLQEKHRCPVVYLTGTVGGMMTTLGLEVKNREGKPLADGTVEKTRRYGELLAEAAERAMGKARPVAATPLEVRQRPLFLPVQNKLYLLAWQLGVVDREISLWEGNIDKASPVTKLEASQAGAIRTELAWLRLGDVEIAAIPGEIYPELVLGKVQDPADPGADFPDAPVEPAIYAQLRGPHRMLIGLANDEIGYIIPKRQWDEKPPFCYGRKKAQYGEVNSLGPDTAPLLCEAFQKLVKRQP
jgi:hypothetical protein